MQVSSSEETVSAAAESSNTPATGDKPKASDSALDFDGFANGESVLDVSGRSLEFSMLGDSESSLEKLYLYKNVFNLMPRELGNFVRLRTLKFFANEINLFPAEFGSLVGLECLQLKVSSPGLSGLPLHKMKDLKELELSKAPPRPSDFPILCEIAGLKCLTKLSICHFSVRYLPPEIGCLSNLEYLDLSFNKMKSLPIEISHLSALLSLKVSRNKLVELPSSLSSLKRLEHLDLSNNRLTSFGSLELALMRNLRVLNLQYNKLLTCCQIPSWICCNLEGNGKDTSNDEFISSSVEMDVFEASIQEIDGNFSYVGGSPNTSLSPSVGSSSDSRCFVSRKLGRGWKRRYYLQQRARQERLNNSRKWKCEDQADVLSSKESEKCKPCKVAALASESLAEGASGNVDLDDNNKALLSEAESENLLSCVDDDGVKLAKGISAENCSCVVDSVARSNEVDNECKGPDASASVSSAAIEPVDNPLSEESKSTVKLKRHSDEDLDNPKPSKFRKSTDDHSNLSCKYSNLSFCSIKDHLPDGFYDAGRDRPFMPLRNYEHNLSLESREVILVDREMDEELDAIALSAQALMHRLKKLNDLTKEKEHAAVDNLQIASLLALFVSDHLGGSDRSSMIERTRKDVSGSNYRKPFVCTCPTGNSKHVRAFAGQNFNTVENVILVDLCEKSLQSIKARRNSIVVPIGTLQFGVCRHRALLMKYLCDRMEPPVPCELVRGYLDFLPHAWNVVLIKRGDLWVRMVVDACRPLDIREETDPEYFCRYVPLSRINIPLSTQNDPGLACSFPSLSTCDEIEKAASSSLVRCKFGSVEAVAKVRTLEVCGAVVDEIKNFEYSCLGEVRILNALKKHSCIVEIFGHQISSKWTPSLDGNPERRILQSAILMEYIEGGSLKNYIHKLSKADEKRVPVELALYIARDVACSLVELHSKHIIHRDVKSENILINLDRKRSDGTPIVKLCDFDRAVPLRSVLHTCCIAHIGIPPPDVCVGTPRWMAPEVLRAMHKCQRYGLEVDVWSYGCLLLELLTLQVPYSELSESDIHDLLQAGKRPPLPVELEILGSLEDPAMTQSGARLDATQDDIETLSFLVDLFRQCTMEDPSDRPTAQKLYEMLIAQMRLFSCSRS